eukprot:2944275-Ditylum_brightwellii.AAC.1
MQTLERGLQHHHSPCRTIRMRKADGTRAITDDENAQGQQLDNANNWTTIRGLYVHGNWCPKKSLSNNIYETKNWREIAN